MRVENEWHLAHYEPVSWAQLRLRLSPLLTCTSLRLGVDNPLRRIAINAANARPALVRCRPAVPPRVHAIQTTLPQARPRDICELVLEAVIGLEESALQAHVDTEARASCIGVRVATSSAGLLPVTGTLEVLLGADIHIGFALEAAARGSTLREILAALGNVLACVLVMPGDVGGGVGRDVGNNTLADVLGDHACGAGWRRGHAEDAGATFFAEGWSGRFLGRASGHREGGDVGHSQQEHVGKQHAGWGICFG